MEFQSAITFRDDFKALIKESRTLALRLGNAFISSNHFLLAMLAQEHQLLARILERVGVPTGELHGRLSESLTSVGAGHVVELDNVPLTPEAESVVKQSVAEFYRRSGDSVGGIHLLLAMARSDGTDAAGTLAEYGVTLEKLERAIEEGS